VGGVLWQPANISIDTPAINRKPVPDNRRCAPQCLQKRFFIINLPPIKLTNGLARANRFQGAFELSYICIIYSAYSLPIGLVGLEIGSRPDANSATGPEQSLKRAISEGEGAPLRVNVL
jgi:hypothetical protein